MHGLDIVSVSLNLIHQKFSHFSIQLRIFIFFVCQKSDKILNNPFYLLFFHLFLFGFLAQKNQKKKIHCIYTQIEIYLNKNCPQNQNVIPKECVEPMGQSNRKIKSIKFSHNYNLCIFSQFIAIILLLPKNSQKNKRKKCMNNGRNFCSSIVNK